MDSSNPSPSKPGRTPSGPGGTTPDGRGPDSTDAGEAVGLEKAAQDAANKRSAADTKSISESDSRVTPLDASATEKLASTKAKSVRVKAKSVKPAAVASGKPTDVAAVAADATDTGASSSESEDLPPLRTSGHRFLFFAAIPSWFVSMIIHIVLLFCLALLTLPKITRERDNEIVLGDAETTQIEDVPIFESTEQDEMEDVELSDLAPTEPMDVQPTELETDVPEVFAADDLEAATSFTELDPLGTDVAPKSDLLKQIGTFAGAGLEGRGKASRARLVREGGGTEGSEKAVQMALKWLQQHQNPNGSWSFEHLDGQCPCRDRGSLDGAYNGATAMALLPFLGAGHTHKEGQYKREVQAGLYFLLSRQQRNGAFIESGGNLYSHGLCAIALSEAYAMTQDQMLMRPAQAALDYIAYAQDPVGGGWRYVARQPGDTSVVGWQLMALKSGRMAYLHVDPSVFQGATKFLDSVQADRGAAYGYKDPGRKPSTTAIGLLCRMYLGWERTHPGLKTGVQRLSKSGPSKNDMYFNYYATQVMRHFEGDEWKQWNEKMREFLVNSQAKKGHETGSWYMGNNHSSISGGRLYCTSMATMILEVYYRHLPIYQKQATEDDFEL